MPERNSPKSAEISQRQKERKRQDLGQFSSSLIFLVILPKFGSSFYTTVMPYNPDVLSIFKLRELQDCFEPGASFVLNS